MESSFHIASFPNLQELELPQKSPNSQESPKSFIIRRPISYSDSFPNFSLNRRTPSNLEFLIAPHIHKKNNWKKNMQVAWDLVPKWASRKARVS